MSEKQIEESERQLALANSNIIRTELEQRGELWHKGDSKKLAGYYLHFLQLIPGAGGVIGAVGVIKDCIGEYVNNRKHERIERLFRAVFERLNRLQGKIDQYYVASDEYTHLIVNGIFEAQYEHRSTKIKMLGFTLAEMASDRWPYLFDVKARLLDIVGEMGEDHAEILQLLASHGIQPLIVGSHNPLRLLDLFNNDTLIQHLEDRRREIILKAAMDWLETRGLVVRSHNKDGSNTSEDFPPAIRQTFMSNELCSVTHLGLDLAEMIRNPEGGMPHKESL